MRGPLVWCWLVVLVACGNQPSWSDTQSDSGPAHDAAWMSDAGWLPPDAGHSRDGSSGAPADAAANDVRDAATGSDGSVEARDAAITVDASSATTDAAATTGVGVFRDVVVDGNAVSIYLPNFVNPSQPVPVVLSLHGLSIPAIAMADITGLPTVADKEGFIAVFPAGVGGTWNTGGAVCGLGAFAGNAADDAMYVEHILDAVHTLQPIDRARVFVSGFSMGGYGTNALACHNPDRFRAAAPAAGGFPSGVCTPGPLPVMIFHGTADGTIAHQCGVEARAAWVAHNGCSAEVDVTPVMGGKCEWSRGCPDKGQVVFCSFEGMGHGWAGSVNPFAFGGGTLFESATSLMWSFFKQQL